MTFLQERAKQYERVAAEVAASCGATALLLHDASLQEGFDSMQNGMHTPGDGLHPSKAGHNWITAQVLPVAEKLWA